MRMRLSSFPAPHFLPHSHCRSILSRTLSMPRQHYRSCGLRCRCRGGGEGDVRQQGGRGAVSGAGGAARAGHYRRCGGRCNWCFFSVDWTIFLLLMEARPP